MNIIKKYKKNQKIELFSSADVYENSIREQIPEILNVLLIDRTTSTIKKNKNIIWANKNYLKYGEDYSEKSQIKPELITGKNGNIIMPRSLKTLYEKKERTKTKAEVFTPTNIIKIQNDEIDKEYINDNLEAYVRRTWLEITCGEAPYMVSRYDMESGNLISLHNRVGFIDRKIQRISKEITDKAEWQRLVTEAYKASYGFEWNGDSLLIARENLLISYRDYYFNKWHEEPLYGLFKNIAEIISYNVFQMDGINYTIPMTEEREVIFNNQLSLFDDVTDKIDFHHGKRVKIMNWELNRMEFFDKSI